MHQFQKLHYQAAGSLVELDLPYQSAERLRRGTRRMSVNDPMVERLKNDLEPILSLPDPREQISAYHDMPYAIFHYPPREEFTLRKELDMLDTRLTSMGKRVTRISLAECLEEAMATQATPEDWFQAERVQGTETVVETDPHRAGGGRAAGSARRQAPAGRPRPPPRHRLHHPRRRAVPGVSDLLAARADEGPGHGAGGAVLPRRTRWGDRPELHGRPRRRAQLPTEDLLRDGASDVATARASETSSPGHRPQDRRGHQGRSDRRRHRPREISEYVATEAIKSHYRGILDEYRETPNKPNEGIAVWVSGFFGSGKSSFAKMLGLSIENRRP